MQKDIFIIKKLSKMIELTVIQKIEDIAMKQKYRWKIGRENKIVTF